MCTLSAERGRIRLELTARLAGRDLSVMLTGGAAHIGATALASPGASTRLLGLPGHREGELAESMATFLAEKLNCVVAASCGIHYDAISKSEIETVLALAAELCEQLLASLRNKPC